MKLAFRPIGDVLSVLVDPLDSRCGSSWGTLHLFMLEGVNEMDFTEAESNLLDLVAEYGQHEPAETFEEEEAAHEGDEGEIDAGTEVP